MRASLFVCVFTCLTWPVSPFQYGTQFGNLVRQHNPLFGLVTTTMPVYTQVLLLWSVLADFAEGRGMPITIDGLRQEMCPTYWKYMENTNVCLGPIGEKTNIGIHKTTCTSQNKFSFVVTADETNMANLCLFSLGLYSRDELIYVGGKRKNGVFVWEIDDTPVSMKDNWAKGQPNGTASDPQDCMAMSLSFENKTKCLFHDTTCTAGFPTFCEIKDANPCLGHGNGGCEHVCMVTSPRSRVCACHPGYKEILGVYCSDDDECLVENGGCDQICTNSPGKYECSCNEGYHAGGHRCKANNDMCEENNGGCQHYCGVTNGSVVCSCLEGYDSKMFECVPRQDLVQIHADAAAEKDYRYIMYIVLPILSAVFAISVMMFILFVAITHEFEKKPPPQGPVERIYSGLSLEVKVSRKFNTRYHPKYGTGV